jgi:hypothetical protein
LGGVKRRFIYLRVLKTLAAKINHAGLEKWALETFEETTAKTSG